MLTLFSCPKSFLGPFKVIQRNAIQSWTKLNPQPQILLLGDEEGTANVAEEFGIGQIRNIARNEFGTPLVNSLFEEAERAATHERLCYLNADIILMSDFMEAIEDVVEEIPYSLIVGQRCNLDIGEAIDFSPTWEDRLRADAKKIGRVEIPNALDFFVYNKGMFGSLPPFALGRPMWDDWLLSRGRLTGVPVIDITSRVTVIHQNHSYSHHVGGKTGVMRGVEAKRNIKLAGGYLFAFTVWDSDYELTEGGVRRRPFRYRWYGDVVSLSQRYPFLELPARL
jgi:hypothetical protein